jgi:hypothetical protein
MISHGSVFLPRLMQVDLSPLNIFGALLVLLATSLYAS